MTVVNGLTSYAVRVLVDLFPEEEITKINASSVKLEMQNPKERVESAAVDHPERRRVLQFVLRRMNAQE